MSRTDRAGKAWWERVFPFIAVALSSIASCVWNVVAWVNTDDYFHILTGRYILAKGFPSVDFLAWTSAAIQPELRPHVWLYQVVLALLYPLGGQPALQLLNAGLVIGIYVTLALLAWKRSGNRLVTGFSVLIAGVLMNLDYMVALQLRAQTGALLFLLLAMLLLEHGGRRRWGAVPLLILANNWHGGLWPVYLMVLGYYVIRERDWPMALGGLALTVSPYGPKTLLSAANFSADYASLAGLSPEWRRTVLWPTETAGRVPFLAFLLVTASTYLGRPRKADLLLVAGTLALALAGHRFVIFVPCLLLPVLAAYWREILGTLRGSGHLARRLGPAVMTGLGILLLLYPALVLMVIAGVRSAEPKPWYPQQDKEDVVLSPVLEDTNAALDYIKEHGCERVLNMELDIGGYMAFAGVPPLIDNRSDVFLYKQEDGSSLQNELARVWLNPSQMEYVAAKYDAEWVLLAKGDPSMLSYLEGEPEKYQMVFHSGKSYIFRILRSGSSEGSPQ